MQFLHVTTVEGQQAVIAADRIRIIEAAADKLRGKDVRIQSVVTVEMATGQTVPIACRDPFVSLMSQFGGLVSADGAAETVNRQLNRLACHDDLDDE